jgi:TetR/AcrR family fatty acid metabolism transcriptional regulator
VSRSPRRVADAALRTADKGEPEKRRAILHAAVHVFAQKGYHGCRIADVAQRAGVAYGLVYHYFKNKEELLESVFAEQWAIFIRGLEAIRSGPGRAAEQLASVCRFVLDVFRTAPDAVRVLILEVSHAPDALRAGSTPRTLEAAIRIVADMVMRGQDEGELRPDVDPMLAGASLLGILELNLTGMVVGLLKAPSEEALERMKKQVVAFALEGLIVLERSPGLGP